MDDRFLCKSCMTYKPISALSQMPNKKPICVTCYKRLNAAMHPDQKKSPTKGNWTNGQTAASQHRRAKAGYAKGATFLVKLNSR